MVWISIQTHRLSWWLLFLCAKPHQADAKAHLPAELPRSLRDSPLSTLLLFTVCPVTKTSNPNKQALTTAAPNICYSEQAPQHTTGLVVLCGLTLSSGSSQPTTKHTFTVTDITQPWTHARIGIVLLAQHKEQWSICINGWISLRFPLASASFDWGWLWNQKEKREALFSSADVFFSVIFTDIVFVYGLTFYGASAGIWKKKSD